LQKFITNQRGARFVEEKNVRRWRKVDIDESERFVRTITAMEAAIGGREGVAFSIAKLLVKSEEEIRRDSSTKKNGSSNHATPPLVTFLGVNTQREPQPVNADYTSVLSTFI
jgi:hypothetical protein